VKNVIQLAVDNNNQKRCRQTTQADDGKVNI
jgi:hypothetical protein